MERLDEGVVVCGSFEEEFPEVWKSKPNSVEGVRWGVGVGSGRRGAVGRRVAWRGSRSAAGSQEPPLLWLGLDMKIDWPSKLLAHVAREVPALGAVGDTDPGAGWPCVSHEPGDVLRYRGFGGEVKGKRGPVGHGEGRDWERGIPFGRLGGGMAQSPARVAWV